MRRRRLRVPLDGRADQPRPRARLLRLDGGRGLAPRHSRGDQRVPDSAATTSRRKPSSSGSGSGAIRVPARPATRSAQTFDERAANADRAYSEAGLLGHRSDRGVVRVLYGLPQKIDHEVSPVPNGPPIEVWIYGDAGALRARRQASVPHLPVREERRPDGAVQRPWRFRPLPPAVGGAIPVEPDRRFCLDEPSSCRARGDRDLRPAARGRQRHALPHHRDQRRLGPRAQRHRDPLLRRARGRLLRPRRRGGAGGSRGRRRSRRARWTTWSAPR